MPDGMSFELTEDQELIRNSVAELARRFDDQYWMDDLVGWALVWIPTHYGDSAALDPAAGPHL